MWTHMRIVKNHVQDSVHYFHMTQLQHHVILTGNDGKVHHSN